MGVGGRRDELPPSRQPWLARGFQVRLLCFVLGSTGGGDSLTDVLAPSKGGGMKDGRLRRYPGKWSHYTPQAPPMSTNPAPVDVDKVRQQCEAEFKELLEDGYPGSTPAFVMDKLDSYTGAARLAMCEIVQTDLAEARRLLARSPKRKSWEETHPKRKIWEQTVQWLKTELRFLMIRKRGGAR